VYIPHLKIEINFPHYAQQNTLCNTLHKVSYTVIWDAAESAETFYITNEFKFYHACQFSWSGAIVGGLFTADISV
jgi:hypothetical protein